jgi:hypothetical protein
MEINFSIAFSFLNAETKEQKIAKHALFARRVMTAVFWDRK